MATFLRYTKAKTRATEVIASMLFQACVLLHMLLYVTCTLVTCTNVYMYVTCTLVTCTNVYMYVTCTLVTCTNVHTCTLHVHLLHAPMYTCTLHVHLLHAPMYIRYMYTCYMHQCIHVHYMYTCYMHQCTYVTCTLVTCTNVYMLHVHVAERSTDSSSGVVKKVGSNPGLAGRGACVLEQDNCFVLLLVYQSYYWFSCATVPDIFLPLIFCQGKNKIYTCVM